VIQLGPSKAAKELGLPVSTIFGWKKMGTIRLVDTSKSNLSYLIDRGDHMKKFMQLCLMTVTIGFTSQLFAQDPNPLIGKWRWDSPDCTKPDFIFEEDKITQSTDADGSPIIFTFKNVKYTSSQTQVTVDFGKSHGLGGAPEKTKMTFSLPDRGHAVMVRKSKTMNDLYRCP